MHALSRVLTIVGLGCLLFAVVARGQSPAPAELEISLVGLGDLPPSVKIADGTRVLEISVPASGRGDPVYYRGKNPLVFFRETTDAEGKTRRVPVATVEFSPAWKKALVVLVSAGRKGGDWNFTGQAFDDSAEGFPTDYARLFNFYRSTLAVNSGDGLEQVPPRESRLIALKGSRARVWMKLAVQRPASWEVLPTFVTQVAPNTRLLIFAYEAPGDGGGMERTYRSISEVIAPEQIAAVR
ncbi:MAG: hypothetical protein WC205_05285 [Opitutaceae bacterium]|jgi:hypothetical protein